MLLVPAHRHGYELRAKPLASILKASKVTVADFRACGILRSQTESSSQSRPTPLPCPCRRLVCAVRLPAMMKITITDKFEKVIRTFAVSDEIAKAVDTLLLAIHSPTSGGDPGEFADYTL